MKNIIFLPITTCFLFGCFFQQPSNIYTGNAHFPAEEAQVFINSKEFNNAYEAYSGLVSERVIYDNYVKYSIAVGHTKDSVSYYNFQVNPFDDEEKYVTHPLQNWGPKKGDCVIFYRGFERLPFMEVIDQTTCKASEKKDWSKFIKSSKTVKGSGIILKDEAYPMVFSHEDIYSRLSLAKQNIVASWLGGDVNDLIDKWGAPDSQFKGENFNLYTYSTSSQAPISCDGYGNCTGGGSYRCKKSVKINSKMRIIKMDYEGNGC